MTNGTNTIVTSIYELRYVDERGGMVYKSFPLLTETIRALIFPEYNYVIYTDKATYNKYSLNTIFNTDNVVIKFEELDSEFYKTIIDPVRILNVQRGEIYERIYAVKNYVEIIYNKFKFIMRECENGNNIVWIDAGLFGTSCHDSWRDYMRDNLVYCKNFLDKIFEKIGEYNFFTLRGQKIHINYEVQDRINKITGENLKIIPGGIFGGKADYVKDIFNNYESIIMNYIKEYNQFTSEQEILSILTSNKNIKFFDFNDWTDLQRALLKILDQYDETRYNTEKCYNKWNT
jgi:hypothetical protein